MVIYLSMYQDICIQEVVILLPPQLKFIYVVRNLSQFENF
jgi:hypothetical protein